jgi:two-component system, OmpR family, phosphate regulon sensor histidine kinase PhoR
VHPGLLLAIAAALTAAPAICLLALILSGAAATGPALLALAVVVLAALVLAGLLARDIGGLAEILRCAAREDLPALARSASALRLPPLERAGRGIERLSRAQAARASQLDGALRASEAIIARLPDPLLVLGGDRAVRRANAAAHAAFGADMAAVLRHPVLRQTIDRAFAQRGTGEGTHSAELSLPVPTPRELHATVIKLDPPLADGGHAIVVLSDRTRERAVERMRADFVANASHELRTPLASLMGFIDTLRGPAADDPPAQQRFLGIMAEQAARMNRLLDDLMSLSRIELSEHQPPSEKVDAGELAGRVAAAFEPRLRERGVTLSLDVPADLPPVQADADQLAQVMTNLVENALKYGRESGTIRLSLGPPLPGARWPARPGLVLAVEDDGAGIPRAHVPRLTERFYRVDSGRTRAAGGTGLGLAIVKHIVNRHRGQLVIESEEGRGSVFSVWLPLGPEK